MLVFFHAVQVKQNFKSAQEKRPIFAEKIFIKKLVPGDNRLVIDRPMRDLDMEEFPVEWARWEQKKSNLVVGTPIEAWNILSDTQKAEFKALNIFTIDQFANLPDSTGDRIMGFNDLRAKARSFLNAGNDSKLEEKLAAQDREMAELRAQIAALSGGKPAKKAKRKLSPEHLAKLQAGRERAKAAA
jgi:hypothetical protein